MRWRKPAEYLRSYAQVKVVLEGDCDERGSTEYNLGLGQRRADAAKQFLESLGIGADRTADDQLRQGKTCLREHTEECWQQESPCAFFTGALTSCPATTQRSPALDLSARNATKCSRAKAQSNSAPS